MSELLKSEFIFLCYQLQLLLVLLNSLTLFKRREKQKTFVQYLPKIFSSVAQSRATLCNPMDCTTSGFPVHHQLQKPTQTNVHRVSDAIQSSHPLSSSPSPLPSIFPSTWFFSNESVLHIRWPKYWSFSFSISPFNEHSGLISFKIDQLDLLAIQETLQSLLQHHSSKASILRCSAFCIVQL